MQFDVGKLNVLKLGHNMDLKEIYNYLAPGNNQLIMDNYVVRDLGILINSEANYSDHISKVY